MRIGSLFCTRPRIKCLKTHTKTKCGHRKYLTTKNLKAVGPCLSRSPPARREKSGKTTELTIPPPRSFHPSPPLSPERFLPRVPSLSILPRRSLLSLVSCFFCGDLVACQTVPIYPHPAGQTTRAGVGAGDQPPGPEPAAQACRVPALRLLRSDR